MRACLLVIAFVLLLLLGSWRNPEPALPRCPDHPAAERCLP